MSYRSSYGSSGDSRRHSSSSRRDSPPRHRSSGSRRSPSPGPSRRPKEEPPQPRDPKKLPESFGRGEERVPEDDSNILQRMKSHYQSSPLSDLYECIKSEKKIKIWTRNFKEVRGVMTGYLVAFDKHWNLALRDVDEVFLKPKKSKTPFLRDIAANENLQDIPAKVPREKKKEGAAAEPEPPKKPATEGEPKKKRSRRKKAKSTSAKRQIGQLFVRGDNIVMVCPFDENVAEEEEEEEEMEGEEGGDDNRNV